MTTQSGIWKYANLLLPSVKQRFRLCLSEGNTPLIKKNHLYFKREDQNPTGSVKDRGMAYQISALLQQGHKNFTLSSSGNAAISAAAYCQQAQTKLTIFVSSKITPAKYKQLKNYAYQIINTPKPISAAYQYSNQNHAYNLRPSKDKLGTIGYQTIAFELAEQLKSFPDAIFIPVSSGTMLVGIAQGFNTLKSHNKLKKLPQFFAIQTTYCHPIAKRYDSNFKQERSNLATGLVAKIVPRKKQIHNIIKSTQGRAYVISNAHIKSAAKWLKTNNIHTSYEGAATLAGYFKHQTQTQPQINHPVILLTGTL